MARLDEYMRISAYSRGMQKTFENCTWIVELTDVHSRAIAKILDIVHLDLRNQPFARNDPRIYAQSLTILSHIKLGIPK